MSYKNPEYIKIKMINRILRNSEVFTGSELLKKNVDELVEIQKKGLIDFRLKLKFRNRNLLKKIIRTH